MMELKTSSLISYLSEVTFLICSNAYMFSFPLKHTNVCEMNKSDMIFTL